MAVEDRLAQYCIVVKGYIVGQVSYCFFIIQVKTLFVKNWMGKLSFNIMSILGDIKGFCIDF